jgi:hypothetical protein
MYRKNRRTQQPLLLSDINDLPERSKERLKQSWAEVFRQEVFLRIDEDLFAVLYDDSPSRPNIPVNILMGLEILKGWRNWSDEELYDHFLFDLQVRYALGCDAFGEDDFDLRTLYYFRRRISEHALVKGEHLVKKVFEGITDHQLGKLEIKTGMQRMDSTMITSQIADLSRLELLIQVLQRLHHILKEVDQVLYAGIFQPYIKESAGQYTYRLKGKEAVWKHIEQVGQVLHDLLLKLGEDYAEDPVYQIAQRFFEENFKLAEAVVQGKTNEEIGAGCLQSLDDLEASYRRKGNRAYKGYAANITETCNPENPVQLITQVQVQPNRTSDIELLKEGLPMLQERMGVDTLVSDGGYVGPEIDQLMRDRKVMHITTGLTGTLPNHQEGRLALSDFEMGLDQAGEVIRAVCPAGQVACVTPTIHHKSFNLAFSPPVCQACPLYLQSQCPIKTNHDQTLFWLKVPKDRASSSQRRRRFEGCKEAARALRPAVEATIFQLKHAFVRNKVRVRGLLRVTTVILCSALAVNLRRIHRYQNDAQRGKFTFAKKREDLFSAFLETRKMVWAPSRYLSLGFLTCFSR